MLTVVGLQVLRMYQNGVRNVSVFNAELLQINEFQIREPLSRNLISFLIAETAEAMDQDIFPIELVS